jgi:Dolichyl-phosphate-mannose-protein mannosyltransferase
VQSAALKGASTKAGLGVVFTQTLKPGATKRDRNSRFIGYKALMTCIRRHKAVALALIVALGFVLRARELGKAGLNEDEVNKVQAARAYLRGDFFVNLEHPMLMKSLDTWSLAASEAWNRRASHRHRISIATAIRLPNAIFGSLTGVVLFLTAEEFFGFEIGLLTALLWAIGTVAIMINREAKEDTLLVFFAWLGFYFYLRAKKLSDEKPGTAAKLYAASGGSFGLMLASKYFPHYLGLNFLYYWMLPNKKGFPPWDRREEVLFFGTSGAAFLLANPVALFPKTLSYMLHYAREGTMTHRGYLMMGQLYFDDPAHLHGGMPIYFYPLFLVLKTPLPVLLALSVGLVEVFLRRREPGHFFLILMFLAWIIPFSLLSAKWFRWMLSWMPAVYMIAAVGIAKVWGWLTSLWKGTANRRLAHAFAVAFTVLFFGEPLWAAVKAAPYYTLYLNPLGENRMAYYFPHDEMNDGGLRQAIQRVCQVAPQGALVGGESRPLFTYYFHKFGRDDLRYVEVSDRLLGSTRPLPSYFVIQNGREYFENISFLRRLKVERSPAWTVTVQGTTAVQVYHFEELARLEASR